MRLAGVSSLVGCATRPGPPHLQPATLAPAGPPALCAFADTSAPDPDAVYVMGIEVDSMPTEPLDCAGWPIPDQERPSVLPMPLTGADLRDVFDSAHAGNRPDVVVTRDVDLASYAVQGSRFVDVVLPWDRTYFLATPGSTAGPISAADRESLARDAVRGDARGAVRDPTIHLSGSCGLRIPSRDTVRDVIAYADGDDVGRQLAERVVALAGGASPPGWITQPVVKARGLRVVAMPPFAFREALASGRILAAVIAVDRRSRVPCGLPALVPLIDTRAHAIVRRGSGVSFVIGTDGTLWFTHRGRP